MSDAFRPDGLDAVPLKAAEAAAALEGLKAPAERAANAIDEAFGKAGDSLTRSLARAAADGEVTLAELARAVLNAVNAAAGGAADRVWRKRWRARSAGPFQARGPRADRSWRAAPIWSESAGRRCFVRPAAAASSRWRRGRA